MSLAEQKLISQETLGRMIGTMRDFFWVVGLITLALGGLGVMNVMLIAVRERTREIGVRKALGATTATIQRQFFLEGFVLTLVSGGCGFVLATGLCALVNQLPMPACFQGLVVTSPAAALAMGVLLVIGIVTSTYPAQTSAQAGGERAGKRIQLTEEDVLSVLGLPFVKFASPEFIREFPMTWGVKQGSYRVRGVSPD